MTQSDIKIILLNATAMTISMAQVETALKVALLVVSIGYTAQRWWLLQVNKKKNN